jgi:opine dehydrogenase
MDKILICGAGQGGHAFSGYLTQCGARISLYTHTPIKKDIIRLQNNQIFMSGCFEGAMKLYSVTTDLYDATSKNDIIFIITDALAHKSIAKQMAPVLSNQHIILISPGVGGALDFANEIKKFNQNTDLAITETDTLLYACKTPSIGHSHVKSIKEAILTATLGKPDTRKDILKTYFPQFQSVDNLFIGLDDSPVFHIVGMIENADRIMNGEDFNFYIDGINSYIAEKMVAMDNERCQVAKKMGIKPRTVIEWLNQTYRVPKNDLYTMIQNTPPYQNTSQNANRSPAPKTLNHRYLLEEIALRAVPTIEIAKILKLETPIYCEMVEKANYLTNNDFYKTGRTLKDMGLTEEDILNWKK